MNHVIATLTNSPQVFFPIRGIFPHEFRDEGEYGQCCQGELPPLQSKTWRNINVVCFRFRRLWGLLCGGRELRKWDISGVEGECAGTQDRDGDLEGLVEVWLESRVRDLIWHILSDYRDWSYLNSLKRSLRNSSPSFGMFTHKLPCLQMEDVPSIAKRIVMGADVLGVR